MKKLWFVLFVFCALSIVACGSLYEPEPVTIGRDYSELKKSPCACLELKKTSVLPQWLV